MINISTRFISIIENIDTVRGIALEAQYQE